MVFLTRLTNNNILETRKDSIHFSRDGSKGRVWGRRHGERVAWAFRKSSPGPRLCLWSRGQDLRGLSRSWRNYGNKTLKIFILFCILQDFFFKFKLFEMLQSFLSKMHFLIKISVIYMQSHYFFLFLRPTFLSSVTSQPICTKFVRNVSSCWLLLKLLQQLPWRIYLTYDVMHFQCTKCWCVGKIYLLAYGVDLRDT